MAEPKPFNLFVYGTLMSPSVFRAVLGKRLVMHSADADDRESFLARDAVLDDYKKISPDNTYLYAVPDPHGRIRGYLVGPLPGECMDALRRYEGRNYSRRRLTVHTAAGAEKAVVFVGNLPKLTHSFGYAFHDPLKQEILLRQKIDAALLETERAQLHTEEPAARRALGELHGSTIRDLLRQHFEAGGISNYTIRHSLMDAPLPDFTRVRDDGEARALARNYLTLVIRQVLFNQIEERIHNDFRYELDGMGQQSHYYERTLSSLAALRMLNRSADLLDALATNCLTELHFPDNHLIDFVRWSIIAADSIYETSWAKQHLRFIRSHLGQGYISLGAELEFSDLGHDVIRDPKGHVVRGRRYDGFIYFYDFALDVLTWKLGGHIDDHHDKALARPRRGFFEVALGSLSIEANLSKPVTNDPWALNQLIHEARRFYPIQPHSVHVSLQLRSQHRPNRDRVLPRGILHCLFALAGDPVRGDDGYLRINRLVTDEIVELEPVPRMLFSEISRRRSREADDLYPAVRSRRDSGRYVQQFRFLRLSPEINYEPIAMALKGLQIALRPGSFLSPAQYTDSRRHRKLFHDLLAWGSRPEPIGAADVERFLGRIYDGLMMERRGKPAHTEAYIAWSLNQLRRMLEEFNALAKAQPAAAEAVPGS